MRRERFAVLSFSKVFCARWFLPSATPIFNTLETFLGKTASFDDSQGAASAFALIDCDKAGLRVAADVLPV